MTIFALQRKLIRRSDAPAMKLSCSAFALMEDMSSKTTPYLRESPIATLPIRSETASN
jgi:hypothetical protein